MSDFRRFAVVGAGGLGSWVASLLVRAGYEVGLVARGKAAAAIRAGGLIVRGPNSEETVPMRVLDEADPGSPVDCVIVATKAWQVEAAARRIPALLQSSSLVLPMQNGVEASPRLAGVLGPGPVLGGVAHLIAWAEAPGIVRWIGEMPIITVGALMPEQRDRVEALAEALRKSGMKVIVSPDIAVALWEKLVFIASLGGVGAVTRSPIGQVLEHPESRQLLQTSMKEIAEVARARGVQVASDIAEKMIRRMQSLPPDATSSMHRDIVNGRPSELDDLLGAVIRAAQGTPVDPVLCRFLLFALLPQERMARRAAGEKAAAGF